MRIFQDRGQNQQEVTNLVKTCPMCTMHATRVVYTCINLVLLCTIITRVENHVNQSLCNDFFSLVYRLLILIHRSVTTHKHTTVLMHKLDCVIVFFTQQIAQIMFVHLHIIAQKSHVYFVNMEFLQLYTI